MIEKNPFKGVNIGEALCGPWVSVESVKQPLPKALLPYVEQGLKDGELCVPTRLLSLFHRQPKNSSRTKR